MGCMKAHAHLLALLVLASCGGTVVSSSGDADAGGRHDSGIVFRDTGTGPAADTGSASSSRSTSGSSSSSACPRDCSGGCGSGTCDIECNGQGPDGNCGGIGEVYSCAPGLPCIIDCSGPGSCKNGQFNCPTTAPCTINCTGASSCGNSKVVCGAGPCTVACTVGLGGEIAVEGCGANCTNNCVCVPGTFQCGGSLP
jgi:hypothetical protein